jgi:hypothetical protein
MDGRTPPRRFDPARPERPGVTGEGVGQTLYPFGAVGRDMNEKQNGDGGERPGAKGNGSGDESESDREAGDRNVLGGPLEPCSHDPETGYLRDGCCRHLRRDPGRHEVCAAVTEGFLEFSKERGNDLVTPRPDLGFPGLEPGDRWCLCLPRWLEAAEAGVAPPVELAATNEAVLEAVDLETLREYAVE